MHGRRFGPQASAATWRSEMDDDRRADESVGSDAARSVKAPLQARPALAAEFELRLLRRLAALQAQFRSGHDSTKVPRTALRLGMELLAAQEGCVAVLPPEGEQAQVTFATPRGSDWDRQFLATFLRGQKFAIPSSLALGRLRRRGRMWGVLAVRSGGPPFGWDAREALSTLAETASEIMARREEERIRDVRARLDCKLMEQLRPKDLFYQILHGLRSLTDYDHSAALLIYDAGSRVLEVAAEQIAWQKCKSQKIGLRLGLNDALHGLLRKNVVYGFDRDGSAWRAWDAGGALGELLDYNAPPAGMTAPRESSLLCAALVSQEALLGVLKVAATHRGALAPHEAKLVSQFLPQVSIALQITQRTASLEQKIIVAHRRHAMADLARGVSHDVNNALGAILPLVQQMQADLRAGRVEPAVLVEDLGDVEQAVQACRRIFGGMLHFARGAARNTGQAYVRQAVECARTILKDGLDRRAVEVVVDLDADLAAVHGVQADLDQLLLNLVSNSRDAMPEGGQLTLRARRQGEAVELVVEDTGCGIPPEHLPKIQEPFFSTKPDGNGLGLAICRSIVWQMRGRLDIQSTPSKGTRVTIVLPAHPGGL
jgi:signal transduction histidine kinase